MSSDESVLPDKNAHSSLALWLMRYLVTRLIFITLIITSLGYYFAYQKFQNETLNNLEKYILTRGELESSAFQLAEKNTRVVRDAWLKSLQRAQNTRPEPAFSQLIHQEKDTVWRIRPELIDTETKATITVLPKAKLNDDFKRQILTAYQTVSQLGPAYQAQQYNTYITINVNEVYVMYLPGVDYAREGTLETLEEILDTELGATPASNPSRSTFWSKVYFDESAKKWMVSVITPVDYLGSYIGSVGQDVLLDDLMERVRSIVIPDAYNMIIHRDGNLIAHPFKAKEIEDKKGDFIINNENDAELKDIYQTALKASSEKPFVETSDGSSILGVAEIQSTGWLFITVYPKKVLSQKASASALQIFIMGGITLAFVFVVLGWMLRRHVSVPLKEFIAATHQVAAGDNILQIQVKRNDELGQLGKAFNAMAKEVHYHRAHLEDQIEAQTQTLQIRNQELQNSNSHLLIAKSDTDAALTKAEEALHQLRTTQEQLVKAEKIAALGHLVGNVAHEINTPIGAIQSSEELISECLKELLKNLPLLYENLDLDLRLLFGRLTERAYLQHLPTVSAKEERSIVRTLTQQLEHAGLKNAGTKAKILMRFHIHHFNDLEPYLPLLQHPQDDLILQCAQNINTLIQNANNISSAVSRAGRIVFALRAFSNADVQGARVPVDLQTSLEESIKHFQSQLNRVNIIREFEPLPAVVCEPIEIQQVWNHVLFNALQASKDQGTLTLKLLKDDNYVMVSVSDNGGGMDENTLHRIFEPFFTTRSSGEGSGLGMAIVKKIIDKHHGRILVHSQLDKGTTVEVYLPLRETTLT